MTLCDSAPSPLPSGPLPRPLHTSLQSPWFTSNGDPSEGRKRNESTRMLVVQAPLPPSTGELRTSLQVLESWACTRLISWKRLKVESIFWSVHLMLGRWGLGTCGA